MTKSANTPYAQPLTDAVHLFELLHIGYALVGGVAAMYYGRARFTDDVDFVAVEGHRDVLTAHPDTMRGCHFDPTCTWKLYHDSGVEIDIWKDQYANEIVTQAQIANLAGIPVKIAEVHDLIAMKLRAGRLQDDYDISEILKHTPVDAQRIRQQVGAELFAHFTQISRRK